MNLMNRRPLRNPLASVFFQQSVDGLACIHDLSLVESYPLVREAFEDFAGLVKGRTSRQPCILAIPR